MEFVVNHTRKQIRCITNVPDSEFDTFLSSTDWAFGDSYEVIFLEQDGPDAFVRMLVLIEDEHYDIPEEERQTFVFNDEQMSRDYDGSMEDMADVYYEDGWRWDEPGATFDW